jgi:hypothetical protein
MVEAAPQGEAFPTGENGGTRKWFGVCEICRDDSARDGVNKNRPNSLGENELAPQKDEFHTTSLPRKLLKVKGECLAIRNSGKSPDKALLQRLDEVVKRRKPDLIRPRRWSRDQIVATS